MARQVVSWQGSRALIILGAVVFVASLVASIPASTIGFFVGNHGGALSYTNATGTIWRGELQSAAVAGAPLGRVKFSLSPFSLLRLSPEVKLSSNGAVRGRGVVSLSAGGRLLVRDAKVDVDLAAAAMRGLLGAPAAGEARINISHLAVSRRLGCLGAKGDIWTNALDEPAMRYDLPALPMNGNVTCEGEKLAIALNGENTRTTASVRLLVDRSLTYEITATAKPSEETVASALRIFGFESDNGAMTYGTVGVLTGAGS